MKTPPNAFRRNRRFDKLLCAELLVDVSLSAPAVVLAGDSRLQSIWREIGNSDKWLHYFPIYERVFSHLVGRPVRFMEIGVQNGGSLRMWKEYLGEHSTVVGVDIDPRCAQFADRNHGIEVCIGSQNDESFLRRIVGELGRFDAILDDGSHRPSDMIKSFGCLFGAGLVPGGVYVVEDTAATYWTSHRDIPHTFSDFVRDLIDIQHSVYHGTDDAAFRPEATSYVRGVVVPALAAWIDRIEVDNSVVTIRKANQEKELPVALNLGALGPPD